MKLVAVAVVACLAAAGLRAEGDNDNLRDKVLALNNVTGDTAMTTRIRELFKDRAELKKLLAEGKEVVKGKEKDLPLTYNACFVLARSAHVAKEYDSAEFFYKLCVEHAFKLKSPRKLARIFEDLIALFEQTKRYDEALFICDKFMKLPGEKENDEIETSKPFILEQKIVVLAKQKKFDDALELTNELVKLDEGGWYFVRRKAEVLREAGKFEDSVAAFTEVIEKLEANGKLDEDDKKRLKDTEREKYVEQCRYMLSSVYIDVGQVDKSVEILDDLVKANADNAGYQNDLGFVLADNDRRLDDAQKAVEKALVLDRAERKKLVEEGVLPADEDKENAAYLDSLAWVHFKKKNYEKALDLMKEAVKDPDSQHPEIYDHLGDIYLALGNKDEAVKAWKKAVATENVNHRDDARKDAIRKKIEANQ